MLMMSNMARSEMKAPHAINVHPPAIKTLFQLNSVNNLPISSMLGTISGTPNCCAMVFRIVKPCSINTHGCRSAHVCHLSAWHIS